MALSVFDEKSGKPQAGELANTLKRTSAHWDNLIAHIASDYPPLDETWNFAGAKWGWSLRLKQKKRAVLYMTPSRGYFLVGIVLGEKAVKAAHAAGLPDSVLAIIDGAKKYAEGRGISVEIRNKKDIANVRKLAAVKMAN